MNSAALKIVPDLIDNVKNNSGIVATKICSRKDCEFKGKEQPLSGFYKDKYGKNGLSGYCINCVSRLFRARQLNIRLENRTPSTKPKVCFNEKDCWMVGQLQPASCFIKNNQRPDGLSRLCKKCSALAKKSYRKRKPYGHRKSSLKWAENNKPAVRASVAIREEKRLKDKLEAIKHQNFLCPGCGVDATGCPDKIILMSFQKSHTHSNKCVKRDDSEFFWSCLFCNVGKQHAKCGSWLAPNKFLQTCLEKDK